MPLLENKLSDIINAIGLTAILFAIIFIRYLFISGIIHYFFYSLFRKQLQQRIINTGLPQNKQLLREIGWSAFTSIIFAVSGTVILYLWQNGHTALYADLNKYSLWYLPISLAIALFIHETYYYWLHRWMHRPKIFRLMHKVHHDSIYTTSLTSFSFHPLESIMQALIVPVIIFFLPMHIYVLLLQLVIMTFSGIINHAGVEIYPQNSDRHWMGKWLIGATHHDLHHKQFRYNYGLYFTFWDKWMKTESPSYEGKFRDKTNR